MKRNIVCPDCNKILCKMEQEGILKKVYLYCKKCKEEKYIEIEPKSHNYQ